MLVIFVLLMLFLSPVSVLAEDPVPDTTLTPTTTPTPTNTPTPTTNPDPTATPEPTATTTPVNNTTSNTSNTINPTNTPKPTLKKAMTTTQQSGVFGNDGLVEEKEDADGLGTSNILGTATSVPEAGDGELLKTLIFLTAATVLIVWTTYIILVQKGVIKSGKKFGKKQEGIIPQPVE